MMYGQVSLGTKGDEASLHTCFLFLEKREKGKGKKELESDKEMFVSGFLSKSPLGSDFFGSRRRNWPRD